MGQFHGQHQIEDNTITIGKLVSDFLNGSDWNISNGNNNATITGLAAPVNPNDAVTKTYVDIAIDSSLKQPEAYNPTVSGNYPLTYGGNPIDAGDTFRITNAQAGIGDGTRDVNGEDLLIALVDTPSATVGTDWMVAESNRTQATESTLGLLKLATQVITDAGANDTDAVTPLKLTTYISNLNINKVAGAGILETTGTFDIQSSDNTMTINADSIQVNIGSTNGASLENSATGLELVANITGSRTFSGGTFTLDTGANAINLNSVAQAGAITIGNNNAGAITLSSNAASSFTSTVSMTIDAPVDNALLANQPTGGTALAIATTKYVNDSITSSMFTPGNGITNNAGVLNLGNSTTDTVSWSMNTNRSFLWDTTNYVSPTNQAFNVQFYSGDTSNDTSPVISFQTSDNFGMNELASVRLNSSSLDLGFNFQSSIHMEQDSSNGGTGGTLQGIADNWKLANQPTGAIANAIATTQYVDDAIGGAREYHRSMTTVLGGAGVGTATLAVAPTTGFSDGIVLLNGQELFPGTDYTVTNATTGEITAAGDTVFTASSVVWSHYTDA